jgi:hypothetical protein
LIRQGRFSEADLEHIAEEIEDMGKRDRREVRSRLTVLIAHRLKWNYQPEQRSPSWRATIMEQRRQIVLVLDDSPSLRRAAVEELASIYAKAVKEAREDTGLAPNAFPKTCPYSLTDLLESRIVPE